MTAAVGTGAYAWDGAAVAYRLATKLPIFGAQLDRGSNALSQRGEEALALDLLGGEHRAGFPTELEGAALKQVDAVGAVAEEVEGEL
ncbi:MAG TPA: hypothetical protein P5061_14795, partial [Mycobacterium sp.]|nr:hypothetical protein [Mycobacterium sp.]